MVAAGGNYTLCSLSLKDDDEGKGLSSAANAVLFCSERARKVAQSHIFGGLSSLTVLLAP